MRKAFTMHARRRDSLRLSLGFLAIFLCTGAFLAHVLEADARATTSEAATSQDILTPIRVRNQVERLKAELERTRGKLFLQPVALEAQSREAFRELLSATMREELPDSENKRVSAGLSALSLLPSGYDLRAGKTDLLASQAAAYYSSRTRKLYVLTSGRSEYELDCLILHELTHALQDQTLGLEDLYRRATASESPEAVTALRYVLEGEATYLETSHAAGIRGLSMDAFDLGKLGSLLSRTANLERAELTALSPNEARDTSGHPINRQATPLKAAPGLVFWQLFDPYLKGQYAVHAAYASGKWPAVDQLLSNPPTSTEQLYHPEKLASPRDEPTLIRVPALEAKLGQGWVRMSEGLLGEAGLRALFDDHCPARKVRLASGWDGDHYALYRSPKGERMLAWWTVWDNGFEASEFAEGLGSVPFEKQLAGVNGGKVTRLVKQEDTGVTLFVGMPGTLDRIKDSWQPLTGSSSI